jgi:hypothetical protein
MSAHVLSNATWVIFMGLALFIRYICYWNLLFLNNVNNLKTKAIYVFISIVS